MKKNCLTCRYEPEWEQNYEIKNEQGICNFPMPECNCAAIRIAKMWIVCSWRGKYYTLTIAKEKFVCGAWVAKGKK